LTVRYFERTVGDREGDSAVGSPRTPETLAAPEDIKSRCISMKASRVLIGAATYSKATHAVLIAPLVVTLFAGVKTVSQGQIWTVERFGAYTRLLQPGLNFVLPYVDRVGRKLNVQEQVVEIPEQSVITRDNASVSVDGRPDLCVK
jgi:hypothetical protein